MTPTYINEILDNIVTLSDGLNNNKLIKNTRDAVLTGIQSFQITPAEQAKLYANFEMQFSLQVVGKLIDITVQSSLIEVQIAVEKKRLLLLDAQIATEESNKLKIDAEIALIGQNNLLVEAQIATEAKRKFDVMAGINIKNAQVVSTLESAKFEEARRVILIHSTESNDKIQKADREVALVNAIALDAGLTISEAHLQTAKDAMDAIPTAAISYVSGVTQAAKTVDPETGSVT